MATTGGVPLESLDKDQLKTVSLSRVVVPFKCIHVFIMYPLNLTLLMFMFFVLFSLISVFRLSAIVQQVVGNLFYGLCE